MSSPTTSTPGDEAPFDAIILAGGAGRRLGGRDKSALTVAGRPLLSRVLQAVIRARRVVVVGQVEVPDGVGQVSEDPPGGGPVAGIAAGLAELARPGALGTPAWSTTPPEIQAPGASPLETSEPDAAPLETPAPGRSEPASWVCILAVDQPAAPDALAPIIAALKRMSPEVDAVCHLDAGGHPQWLLAAYRRPALQHAMSPHGSGHGIAMRRLVQPLRFHYLSSGAEHVGDVDTWADHAHWEDRLGRP